VGPGTNLIRRKKKERTCLPMSQKITLSKIDPNDEEATTVAAAAATTYSKSKSKVLLFIASSSHSCVGERERERVYSKGE